VRLNGDGSHEGGEASFARNRRSPDWCHRCRLGVLINNAGAAYNAITLPKLRTDDRCVRSLPGVEPVRASMRPSATATASGWIPNPDAPPFRPTFATLASLPKHTPPPPRFPPGFAPAAQPAPAAPARVSPPPAPAAAVSLPPVTVTPKPHTDALTSLAAVLGQRVRAGLPCMPAEMRDAVEADDEEEEEATSSHAAFHGSTP